MKFYLPLILFVFVCGSIQAQKARQFEQEVQNLLKRDSLIKDHKDIILFTGSSSVRLWPDLEKDFPDKNVLNRGFGGSTMRDMLYYADQLVVRYNPKTIFIYEGDNDLGFANATTKEILASADSLMTVIRAKLPKDIKVYFISPKPSIIRWHLKDQYISFNRDFKIWTQNQKGVYFIDVWSPMINADGSLKKDLFLEDGLHMNRKGYDLWLTRIKFLVK